MINYPEHIVDLQELLKTQIRVSKKEYIIVEPKVYESGKTNTITVRCRHSSMKLDGEFLVMIQPVYSYAFEPGIKYNDSIFSVKTENGRLKFDYFFEKEQLYRIAIAQETSDGVLALLTKDQLYAVDSDLYALKPLKGDLHCHTIYSDGFETPEMVVEAALKLGFDFIAVTDHNSYEGSAVASEWVKNNNIPLTIIHGEEYSSSFTPMHIISLGSQKPLDEQYYLCDMIEGHSEVDMICSLVAKIKENDGISMMCHPLWKPFCSDGRRMDVSLETVRTTLQMNIFDAVEVVGGSPNDDITTSLLQFQIASENCQPGIDFACIGTTDSHNYSTDPICGKHFTLLFAEGNTEEYIMQAIREKKTVAVQLVDKVNTMCFGSSRLCMYASFLLSTDCEN